MILFTLLSGEDPLPKRDLATLKHAMNNYLGSGNHAGSGSDNGDHFSDFVKLKIK